MDTPNFILGSLTSLGFIFLGIGIYTTLRMNRRVKELEKLTVLIKQLEERSKSDFNATHHSIDSLHVILSKDINEMNSRQRSYVDSRLDKLTTNISNEISMDRSDISDLRKMVEDVAIDHSDRLATLETFKKIDEDKIEQINS